ncbi:uncharacterized protein LOC132752062 [Ruditapes philippinarum]|uniref:uncharacterized protein LOC132752062 n=1 Tax=Ruditapes philippinarum TaxID=129788 RepID=UPI00295B846C|nr:uncharacterized protein LOC132752062 [Ruditapes philippinarum]
MILPMYRVDPSPDLCRNFAAIWVFFLSLFKAIYADTPITITSRTCGETYDMDMYKNTDVYYDGSDVLYENPCQVQFTKTSYEQFICIRGDDIRLDCGTELEYHEDFVKNYINPEVEFSCYDTKKEEWCPSQYQDNIYVVIRKDSRQTTDRIRLRVYLKDVPDDDYPTGSLSGIIILYIAIPIVFVVMCTCLVLIIRKRQSATRPPVTYQTTSGAINVQAGQMNPTQHNPLPYQPIPIQHSGLQGNYNVHPMQSAYPVQAARQNPYSHQGNTGQNYSSAPPIDPSAPPPPYESVISQKH